MVSKVNLLQAQLAVEITNNVKVSDCTPPISMGKKKTTVK